jgi:hypothetical protein
LDDRSNSRQIIWLQEQGDHPIRFPFQMHLVPQNAKLQASKISRANISRAFWSWVMENVNEDFRGTKAIEEGGIG